jgi:hypothetical protein
VLLTLQRLPASIQAAVLANEAFVEKYELPVSPLPITFDDIKIPRDQLLDAFARAGDGGEVEMSPTHNGQPIVVKVRIAEDGAGLVEFGSRGMRTVAAGLCHHDRLRRREILANMLARCTVTPGNADELRRLIDLEPFTHELFVKASNILSISPEEFINQLTAKLMSTSIQIEGASWGF